LELGGVDEEDIKMLMEQTKVSRNRAIATLRQHESDVVNAIMALSE